MAHINETLLENAPVVGAPITRHVLVCTGKSCSSHDSQVTLDAFYAVLAQKGLLYGKRGSWEGTVLVSSCGSIGLCQVGPAVMVYPDGVWYYNVQAQDVLEIVESHLINNQPVERLVAKKI